MKSAICPADYLGSVLIHQGLCPSALMSARTNTISTFGFTFWLATGLSVHVMLLSLQSIMHIAMSYHRNEERAGNSVQLCTHIRRCHSTTDHLSPYSHLFSDIRFLTCYSHCKETTGMALRIDQPITWRLKAFWLHSLCLFIPNTPLIAHTCFGRRGTALPFHKMKRRASVYFPLRRTS